MSLPVLAPLLEKRRAELETCAFCPKLSRAVCPVSNADGRETTTPWGKMSSAYLLARGGVELTPEQAWPPWACTGCFACREACDLKNDVAGTLLDARAELMSAGVAPEPAKRVVARHGERTSDADRGLDGAIERARARGAVVDAHAPVKLLVGCFACRMGGNGRDGRDGEDDPPADAIVATSRLVGGAIDVVHGCCGAPLRNAGDREGFVRAAKELAATVEKATLFVVADSGCAHAIAKRYRDVEVSVSAEILHLVELAARELPRLRRLPIEGTVRYHDACHLGRGLGVYDAPRTVLSAILGRAPEEFARSREAATCAGGGGLVPITSRATADAIADERLTQHDALGGGAVATTCGSSRKLMSRGGTRVYDLTTLIARALEPDPPR